MALSEKWIPLRENDIYDLPDKKHDRREKPVSRSYFSLFFSSFHQFTQIIFFITLNLQPLLPPLLSSPLSFSFSLTFHHLATRAKLNIPT